MNARSIIDKFDEFTAVILRHDPDIVGVTESWASDKILDAELSVPGYDMFRQDRCEIRGVEVLLYVKSYLKATEFITKSDCEQVWCHLLDYHRHSFYIGVCYRTPNDKIFGVENHAKLRNVLKEMRNKH